MKLPHVFSQLLLVAVGVMVGGCSQSSDAGGPIEIGMLAPLTGNGARFGKSQRDAVQLAMDEINANGGVRGRKMTLVVEDTKTEPPTAVTALARLADRQTRIGQKRQRLR